MSMHKGKASPFLYSDTNKRYHTYDYYLRHRYGGKCAKIALDAGFTCPNRDGTCGTEGCIYCSPRGSGDFTFSGLSIKEQYDRQCAVLLQKWGSTRYIPYLQAYTNTYAPISVLRGVYEETLALPGAVAFHIATRADCLGSEVLSLLAEVSERIDLTVELGLQSVHDTTAAAIGRGHGFSAFSEGYFSLREAVPRARISVHLINGLPGEDAGMMIESAYRVSQLEPDEVKLHLLHVLRDTRMAKLWEEGRYTPLTLEEYTDILVKQLELFSPEAVIGRITGDGGREALLAPLWSLKKLAVMNILDRKMVEKNTVQGRKWAKCVQM